MYLVVLVNLFVTLNHKMYNQIVLIIHLFCFVNISIIIIEGADKSLNVYNKEIGDDTFKKFGNDGKMTFEQFSKALKDFKIVVCEEHRQEAFNEMKKEGKDYITVSAFTNYEKVSEQLNELNALKNAFYMFCPTGSEIDKTTLARSLESLSNSSVCTETDCLNLITESWPTKTSFNVLDFIKMILDADEENDK
ncbi:uncharacterized protein LOC126901556 isoform X3 [Daktulosphaira vitifoliae]|uniref:uncharacterized protein LOC126901556 isoform X3 n=1 Tax=Daktulosphaira vitifoliae TaxID=58002 RepID=UPI0021AAFA3C|nr:uncharacterized protein LOC126901556 isoform X3 [Daktulosphaira vitifoliae]